MGYIEDYERQKAEGKTHQVNYNLKTQWYEGETIVGKLVGIDTVHFDDNNIDRNAYLFDTDFGLMQTVLGAGIDAQADDIFTLGGVYAVTFDGKKEISGGRSINMYTVETLVEGGDSDAKTD